MLLAKYQPYRPSGSEEEVVLMVFIIYGHGSHLEFRTKTILATFHSPNPWRLHMKFGSVVSEKKSFESVDRQRRLPIL